MKKVVEQRKDIAFFMKLFPLTQIHPEAYDKSRSIVCAKDNAEALKRLEDAYAKIPLPEPCTTDIVDKSITLGRQLGVTGTPAIYFSDGTKVGGAIGAEQIINKVEEAAAAKK